MLDWPCIAVRMRGFSQPEGLAMLRVLGSIDRLCGQVSRRAMLRVGSLGAGAALLPQVLQAASGEPESERPPRFAQAERVILLYLYGAAPQHELFDPKPDAPLEIRGEMQPIATSLPGVQISEGLPRLAALADQVTLLRSMTHPYNIHSAAYTMTGVAAVDIPMELNPYDARHWPWYGSVLEYLDRRDGGQAQQSEIPFQIGLPFQFSSKCGEFRRGGPYGGFLGTSYNPVWTEFEDQGTRTVLHWRGDVDQPVHDPYVGISPESRLTLSRDARLRPELTLDRLDRRRSLQDQLDEQRRTLDTTLAGVSLDRFEAMAYSLLTSQSLRQALDVSQEPVERREQYGMTLFGQSTLAGLRLLEAGARVVTVIWDEYGTANSAWDTHFNHYERLRGELLPGLDAALSSLLTDLDERGLLDTTLVMCLTEHGRTPQIFPKERGVGREHWSQTYCNLIAGGGVAAGRVIGRSDKEGGFVAENPVSPKDVLCTLYHLLGVPPHTTVPDPLGRPLPLVSEGRVLEEALG